MSIDQRDQHGTIGRANLRIAGVTHTTRQVPVPLNPWLIAQRVIALVVVAVLALRIELVSSLGVTAGFVLSVGLLPLWFPVLTQFRGARLLMTGAVVTVIAGVALTRLNSVDHHTDVKKMIANSVALLTVFFGIGVALWARTLVSDGVVATAFGVGLVLGISTTSALYSSNPWRFGFSVPITVLVLGLTAVLGRRWIDLSAVVVLTGASATNDARSGSAILLLAGLFLVWQTLPANRSGKGSAARIVVAIAVLGVVVYFVAQNLILSGLLGEATQQRSQAQVDTSGSLILGGRPELAATAALMTYQPSGFGSGTLPSFDDLAEAKDGMSAINYDPNNGYVERFMFGTGYELHSTVGDLWAQFGLVGLAFLGVLAFVFLRGLGEAIAGRCGSGIMLFLAVKTLWNLCFAPFASSSGLLMLFLALVLVRHGATGTREPDLTAVVSSPVRGTRPTPAAETGPGRSVPLDRRC